MDRCNPGGFWYALLTALNLANNTSTPAALTKPLLVNNAETSLARNATTGIDADAVVTAGDRYLARLQLILNDVLPLS